VRGAVIDADAKKWPVDMTASRAEFGGGDCLIVSLECAHAAAPSAPPPAPAGESFHGGFLAGVGHDMRTPLNVILGYGEMMQTPAAREIDFAEIGELVCDSARALLANVDDLIELANLERGGLIEPVWTDPLEVLNAAVRGVRSEAKLRSVRVVGDLSGAPAAIWCDERACRRIITTLLHDAVRRSRRDGEAQLSVAAMAGDGCRFTLRDDGAAPSKAAVAAALDPNAARDDFDRTPSSSAGRRLGLTVAHRLAGLHGGRLAIEAGRPRGVVVTVELPGPAVREPPPNACLFSTSDAAAE